MKKMKNRIFSLVLSFAMVLSLLGGIGIEVKAEDQAIDVVEVDVELPVVGGSKNVVFSVPEDAGYTVVLSKSPEWFDAGGNKFDGEMQPLDICEAIFKVIPETGYKLTKDTAITVNEGTEGVALLGAPDLPAEYFGFTVEPLLLGQIAEVELTAVPEAKAGEKAAAYHEAGEHYSASGSWKVYDSEIQAYKSVAEDYTFAKGEHCRLDILVKLDAGYAFADEYTFTINGRDAQEYGTAGDGVMVEVSISTSLVDAEKFIDEIKVNDADLPKPVVGEALKSGIVIPVKVGCGYTLSGYWLDEDDETKGVFTKGKHYEFVLTATADTGYAFAEYVDLYVDGEYEDDTYAFGATAEFEFDYSLCDKIDKISISNLPKAEVGEAIPETVKITVPPDAKYSAEGRWFDQDRNEASGTFEAGKWYSLEIDILADEGYEFVEHIEMTVDGVKEKLLNDEGNVLGYSREFSFRKVIDKVEVTGAAAPEIGKAPSVADLKVPDGANYRIAFTSWYDHDTGENVETFEAGHTYVLDIELEPAEGFEFAEDALMLLDGEEPVYCAVMSDRAGIEVLYSFKEVISEIKVDGVQSMKVGEKSSTAVKVPEGAKYFAEAQWYVWNDTEEAFEEFAGTFEAGKVYELNIGVFPNEGYRFDEGTTAFYVNGKKDSTHTGMNENNAWYAKSASEGLKVIKKVEFTIEKPEAGFHSSIDPVIKVKAGANYELEEYVNWLVGNSKSYNQFEGYFSAEKEYGVEFAFVAKSGYVFAEDLKVIVNGVTMPKNNSFVNAKAGMVQYFFAMTSGSGTGSGGTPETGDNLAIELLAMMFVLSGAGVICTNHMMKRKRW